MPANTPAPSFVNFNNALSPTAIEFLSVTWTDDRCTYGDSSTPIDYTVCLNTK